jgi:hypothetical protein
MLAKITWKRFEEGGRRRPPEGVGSPPYTTTVRFPDCNEPWPPANAWSLVIEKCLRDSSEYEWLADVRYLAHEAPHGEIRANHHFELYEGAKCVATGVILGG